MNINELSSQVLHKALGLLAKKEAHQAKIADIEKELLAIFGESDPAPAAKGQTVSARKAGKQGQVKAAIVALLKESGSKGITLKEMARKLKKNPNRLNTWLYATGRKIKQIKRLDRGVYGWVE